MPMHPQFTAWQAAPHSEVTCTACHIGEGAKALVRAKLAGTRQLYHVLTNQVPKPIPGVADMRPALETCGNCHWPGRDSGDRHHGQAGVRGRRRQLGNRDDPADVRWRAGPADIERPGDSLACRSRRPHRVRLHGSRAADDPLRAAGRQGRQGQGVQGRGRHRRGDRQRRTAGDGLHRLSQRAGASDRADRRAGRRRRDRERQHQPRSAVRSPRECPAGQVGLPDPGAGAGRNREGIPRLLYRQERRRRRGARTDDRGGEERVSAECVSGDEGDVWRLSRQPRTHHVERMRALSRWRALRRTAARSTTTASIATSRSSGPAAAHRRPISYTNSRGHPLPPVHATPRATSRETTPGKSRPRSGDGRHGNRVLQRPC